MSASASFGGFGVLFTLEDGWSENSEKIKHQFESIGEASEKLHEKIEHGFERVEDGVKQIGAGIAFLEPIMQGLDIAEKFEANEVVLKRFLGTSELAEEAFANIRKEAHDTTFNVDSVFAMNKALIVAGKSADEAREVIHGLTEAVAGVGGHENDLVEMESVMRRIAENGSADARILRQMSKINVMGLLAESTGRTVAELQKMPVTYDMISAALKKAGREGGKYFGATNAYAKTTEGKLSQLKMTVYEGFAEIGKVAMPILVDLITRFEKVLRSLVGFFKSGFGQIIIKVLIAALAFKGLVTTVSGLISIFVGLGETFAAAATFLAPLIGFIAIFAIIVYAIQDAVGGLDNLWLVIKGLAAVFATAGKEGFNMSEQLAQALENIGMLDFVVAMGTWFVRIKEFFSGFMEGLMEVWDMVSTVFSVVWTVISSVFNAITTILGWFGVSIRNNTSSLESWVQMGKMVAYIVGTVIVIALAAYVYAQVAAAIATIAAWWWLILIILVVVAVILILVAIVYGVYKAFEYLWELWKSSTLMKLVVLPITILIYQLKILWGIVVHIGEIFQMLWEKVSPVFDKLIDKLRPVIDMFIFLKDCVVLAWGIISEFFSTISDEVSGMYAAGKAFVMAIWEGIKSVWSSFTAWLSHAWHDSLVGKAVDYLIGDVETPNLAATGTMDIQAADANKSKQNLQTAAEMSAQRNQQPEPIVTHSNTEKVTSIQTNLILDGDKIAEAITNKQQMEAARQ